LGRLKSGSPWLMVPWLEPLHRALTRALPRPPKSSGYEYSAAALME
jgi:hypothetical protein